MKSIYIIIGIILFLIIYYFVCQHRIRKTRKFQEEMKPGDRAKVLYGEKYYIGTLKSSLNTKGEDMGLGKIWVTVSFRESEDYPTNKDGCKILAKNYQRQDIYPI